MSNAAIEWALKQPDLTWGERGVLAALCSFHSVESKMCRATSSEIIDHYPFDYTGLTRIMKRLMDRKLVERIPGRHTNKPLYMVKYWDGKKAISEETKRERMAKMFDDFWAAYPKKQGKKPAHEVWHKAQYTEKEVIAIMEDVKARKMYDPEWKKNNGQFIPRASTYLNAERWLDGWLKDKANEESHFGAEHFK